MTAQEIHKELFEDIETLKGKFAVCTKDFQKIVLKLSRYPVTKTYDCRSKEKKNLFVITFTALKRSDWKKPSPTIVGIYTRPEGKYAAAMILEQKLISIYPPHFFKRYRERIVKDESLTNEEIIRRYFEKSWGLMCSVVNEDFQSVYHSFEQGHKDDKVSFVAAGAEGYCFGERQGQNIDIIKTIISEDMLIGKQKVLFDQLKEQLKKANKEKYGVNI